MIENKKREGNNLREINKINKMFDNFWNMFGDKFLIQIVHGLINKVFLNYIFVLISCR